MFAQAYPNRSGPGSLGGNGLGQMRPASPPAARPFKAPSELRTPLGQVLEEHYTPPARVSAKQGMSSQAKDGLRKFLCILLIVFVGSLLYSSIAYTLSHNLTTRLGFDLFDDTGSPSSAIIVIHSLVFIGFVYLVIAVLEPEWK